LAIDPKFNTVSTISGYFFSAPKLGHTQPVLLELPIAPNFRQAEAMCVPIALDPIKEELK